MQVSGKPYRTIWLTDDGRWADIIDKTLLPNTFKAVRLRSFADVVRAIKTIQVRGATLIGVAPALTAWR